MAFGVRNNPKPGGNPAQFWACPNCAEVVQTDDELVNHLMAEHNYTQGQANKAVKGM